MKIDINLAGTAINFGPLQDSFTGFSAGNPNIGQLRLAQVLKTDPINGTIELFIISDKARNVSVAYPGVMVNPDGSSGLWFGLKKGDILLCGIGPGNRYYIINKIGNANTDAQNLTLSDTEINATLAQTSSIRTNLEDLTDGTFLLKSGNVKLRIAEDEELFIGNLGYGSINFDIKTSRDKLSSSTSIVSNQQFNFNNAGYCINGIIYRDKRTNIDGDIDSVVDPKIYKYWYKNLSGINFDPSIIASNETKASYKRNPPLLENRSVVYEFPEEYFIESDEKESRKQNPNTSKSNKNPLTSRRKRKEDALSLSLVSPNYLIEKIEGTITDINGNIIDINRNILPIGGKDGLATLDGTEDSYYKVRELHRKGLAYHWELNARKDQTDLNIENGQGNEYAANDDELFKKNRSRLFIDIDKEGQFKINIPASSEKGNVSLLSRYENYTTVNPAEKDNKFDYDFFKKNDDTKTDILLDQYGYGCASLVGNDKLIAKDRITTETIKFGTVYHDISKTCVYPIETEDTKIQNRIGILSGPDNIITENDGQTTRPILKNTSENSIITKEVIIDGDNANAGGRSGTAVFDGMLNFSIGANTVDKQSLWLDTQGGVVSRLGSDINGISLATQTDGDVYLQIGGDPGFRNVDGSISDTDPDPRFKDNENIVKPSSNKANVFEIRVMQGNGQYCRILIDNKGVLIASPKSIEFRTDEDLLLYAGGSIRMTGENIYFHEDEAITTEVPIHRQIRDYEKVYEKDAGGGIALYKKFLGAGDILGA